MKKNNNNQIILWKHKQKTGICTFLNKGIQMVNNYKKVLFFIIISKVQIKTMMY